MFNLQGSEIIFILLIALVVLGPEKLPGAIRRMTSLYAELRKLSSGFQDEFKSVIDEPMREMKSTADLMKSAGDPMRIAEEAEREAELEAAAEKKARQARDTTAAMEAAGAAHLAAVETKPADEPVDEATPVDAFADPVDDEGGSEPSTPALPPDEIASHDDLSTPAPLREAPSADPSEPARTVSSDDSEEKSA